MNQSTQNGPTTKPVGKARFVLGGILLVGGFLSPLLIPLVTASDLPGNWKAILSTGLVAGLPEVGMLLAVAVLGKDGFAQLKELFFSRFRKITEPSSVSAKRYRIGLFMFFMPILLAWLNPYLAHFFPYLASDKLWLLVVTDMVFAASFIVLGASFWEKIRCLFVHDEGRSVSPAESATND